MIRSLSSKCELRILKEQGLTGLSIKLVKQHRTGEVSGQSPSTVRDFGSLSRCMQARLRPPAFGWMSRSDESGDDHGQADVTNRQVMYGAHRSLTGPKQEHFAHQRSLVQSNYGTGWVSKAVMNGI